MHWTEGAWKRVGQRRSTYRLGGGGGGGVDDGKELKLQGEKVKRVEGCHQLDQQCSA